MAQDARLAIEQRILWVMLLGGGAYLIYLLSPVLTPFIAAACLAYIGDPLVDRLERLKLSRTLGVVIVFLLTFFALGLLVILVLPVLRSQIENLLARLPEYVQWVESNVLPRLYDFTGVGGGGEVGLSAFLAEYGSLAGGWGSRVLASVSRSGTSLMSGIITLLLVPVVTFYMLRDWDEIVAIAALLIPRRRREMVYHFAHESDLALGGFLRGQFLVMLGLGMIYSGGLALLGLPYAVAVGVVAGLVSFVPYLGFVVGIGLAGLAALVEGAGILGLAGVVAVFGVGQLIEGMFLTPRLVGSRVGLHPVLVIFSVLAFGQLFGFFGVLMALPVAAVLSVLARHAHRAYFPDEHDELKSRR